jgi:hypothetical protein
MDYTGSVQCPVSSFSQHADDISGSITTGIMWINIYLLTDFGRRYTIELVTFSYELNFNV